MKFVLVLLGLLLAGCSSGRLSNVALAPVNTFEQDMDACQQKARQETAKLVGKYKRVSLSVRERGLKRQEDVKRACMTSRGWKQN